MLCGLVVFAAHRKACAGNVVPMTAATLADHAGQVIIGTVLEVRSYWADDPGRIESEVLWGQVEYLKGALAGADDRFTLVVPGGAVDGMHMAVACTPRFQVGERWLLFLLPTYKVFPVVGFEQGAFRIETDAEGVARVFSEHSQAIAGVSADGFFRVANSRPARNTNLPVARDRADVTLPLPIQQDEPALSLAEFRELLAPVLAQSRDHGLSEPAGKRARVTFTPVPLKHAAAPGVASEAHGRRAALRVPAEARPREATGAARARRSRP